MLWFFFFWGGGGGGGCTIKVTSGTWSWSKNRYNVLYILTHSAVNANQSIVLPISKLAFTELASCSWLISTAINNSVEIII